MNTRSRSWLKATGYATIAIRALFWAPNRPHDCERIGLLFRPVLRASLLGCLRSGEGAVPGEEMGPAHGAVNGIRQRGQVTTTQGWVYSVQRERKKR